MNTIVELCEVCGRYALDINIGPDGRKACLHCRMNRFCPICNGLKDPVNSTCTDSWCQEASHFFGVARDARKGSRAEREALKRACRCQDVARALQCRRLATRGPQKPKKVGC